MPLAGVFSSFQGRIGRLTFLFASIVMMLFNSLIRTHFLPVPLMRLIYLALATFTITICLKLLRSTSIE